VLHLFRVKRGNKNILINHAEGTGWQCRRRHIYPFCGEIQSPSLYGVPIVLEQKTTILGKCLYLLVSLRNSPVLVRRRRQTVEVGKKTLFMGEILQ
jgi:hypothetical protein